MRATLHKRRLHADLDTPVSAYLKLREGARVSFLFESVAGDERWARFSILGSGARRRYRYTPRGLEVDGVLVSRDRSPHDDPLDELRGAYRPSLEATPSSDAEPPFVAGIFGFLSYDLARRFEHIGETTPSEQLPLFDLIEPETLCVFDNRSHHLTLYGNDPEALEEASARLRGTLPPHTPLPHPGSAAPLDSRPAFEEGVERAKELIRAGEIIQVVLSRRFALPPMDDTFHVYRGLRAINPSPYMYFLDFDGLQVAGASPEVMVRVRDGTITVRPIAGTRPRGADEQEDRRLEDDLRADPKERAEHVMLVDLGRNDVGRVALPGTVHVPTLMTVERYSHVQHLVSEVRGTLRDDRDAFDAVRATFPAGTLSGAPKIRAMQVIDELESHPRGIYGGAIGYFGPRGDADFGIAIRSLVSTPEAAIVRAGAGIVADSAPPRESDETEHKASAVLRAIRWASSQDAVW